MRGSRCHEGSGPIPGAQSRRPGARPSMFDYLADPRNELEWNPKVEVMEKITDGPVGLGTKFRAKWTKSKLVTDRARSSGRLGPLAFHQPGAVVAVAGTGVPWVDRLARSRRPQDERAKAD